MQLVDAHVGVAATVQGLARSEKSRAELVVDHGFSGVKERQALLTFLRNRMGDDPLSAALVQQALKASRGSLVTMTREEAAPDRVWYKHEVVMEIRRAADVDGAVVSLCSHLYDGTAHGISVYRPWRNGKRFSQRERALVELCNNAVVPFYAAEVKIAADSKGLSPRIRQTLELLLVGKSEKEIADAMQLSRHTVHDYIKQIYRHHGVASRSELLAKFIS